MRIALVQQHATANKADNVARGLRAMEAAARTGARLVNGRFDSNVPLLVQSFRSRPRAVDGTIGKGGRQLDLHTVNGSIHLQFATD